MSLIEEARQYQARKKGPRCTVALFLERITADQRRQVTEALADPDVQVAALHRVMADKGWKPPKPVTLNRHRKRECLCDD